MLQLASLYNYFLKIFFFQWGITALVIASYFGNLEVVQLLLKMGAKVNTQAIVS